MKYPASSKNAYGFSTKLSKGIIALFISTLFCFSTKAQLSTTTTLTSSNNPACEGSTIIFTATITPNTATGTVNFYDGAILIGSDVISGGTVTFSISSLSVGVHSITAVYTGDLPNYSGSTSSVVSQTITARPIATITYAGSPYCSNGGTASVSLTGTSGGTFSSTSGLSINSSTGAINLGASTAGTYTVTYTIAAAGGCPAVTATDDVTITRMPTASISYPGSPYCSTGGTATVSLTGTAGGVFSSTPGLAITSSNGDIDISGSVPGTYMVTYTISGGGCPTVTTSTSVTITAMPAASINYAGSPYCSNSGTGDATITGTTGGVFTASPAGLSINSATGDVNLAASTPGTYTVTYTISGGGCPTVTASTSITITAQPNATIDYAGDPYCSSGGTANVTLTGTAGGTYSSSAGLSINGSTGAINLGASTPGGYIVTYSIPASGGCAAFSTSAAVTIVAASSATISYSGSPYCNNGTANVTLTGYAGGTFSSTAGLSINSSTGAINLSASTPGTYIVTYTIPASAPCPAVTTTASITILNGPAATITYAGSPYCMNGGTANVTLTGTAGGTFSSTAGLTINSSTGAITLGTSAAGTYTVTYTMPASGGCPGVSVTTSVTVVMNPTAVISYPGSPYCTNGGTANVTLVGTGGGTFTSTAGLSINSSTGAINLASSTAGTYTITYTVAAVGCPSFTTTATVNIKAAVTITLQPRDSSVCQFNNVTFSSGATGTAPITQQWQVSTDGGLTWSNIAGATGTTYTINNVNPSLDGNVYRCVFTNSCGSTASNGATLTVAAPLNPGINPVSQTACTGAPVTFTAYANGGIDTLKAWWQISCDGGATWTDIPGTLTWVYNGNINTTYTFTPGPGQSGCLFRAVFANGHCPASGSIPATLTILPVPTVNQPPNIIVCNGSTVCPAAFTGTAGSYTWTNNNTSIGLGAGGTGNIPCFTAINNTSNPVTATITVTPINSGGGTTCPGEPKTFTITVLPTPPCLISALSAVTCPGGTNTYTGPAGLDSYSWTITGNGTISGSSTSQTVTVITNNSCGSYTLTLNGGLSGCSKSCAITITASDATKPVITLSAATPVACNPDPTDISGAFGIATVTDNCTTGLTANGTIGAETGAGCIRSVTKTWTVTDNCGNTATATQTVSFTRDTTRPVITLTAAGSVPCNPTAAQINAAFGTASVTDNCSAGLTATGTVGAEVAGAGCNYSVTKTWTVTDACGNTKTATQTITFKRDTQIPVITLTAAGILPCNPTNAQIIAAFGTATVTDNCSAGLVATGTVGAETGSGCLFSTTKSWTVTDACGNTGTATQTVTYTRDVTKPVITVSPAGAVPCNPTAADINGAFGTATVTDNCSAGLVATGVVGAETGAGCIHSVTKTWNVTDACGNIATPVTQTVTFTRDTTKPVITLSAPGAVPCNPSAAQISGAFGNATVTDNCSAGLTATGTLGAETGGPCTFTTTKTWTVTDACGNTNTATQTLTYTRDTQAPVITLTPAATLPCNPNNGQISGAFGTATVTDNCTAGLVATGTLGAETGGPCIFSTTKTWTVTDACGNTGTTTQTVSYTKDVTKPVITVTPAGTVPCNPTAADINGAFGTATVTDNCSPGLTATGTVGSEVKVNGPNCDYTITKTWTATDACGNVANAVTQTLTYQRDTTKPVITISAPGAVPCNPTPAQIGGAFGNPSVTDNCSSGLTATGTIGAEVPGAGCLVSVTKTWTVTDACGNTGTATQTITFTRDTQVPIITLTPAGALPCNPTNAQIIGAFGTASVTDNCSSGLTATGTVGAETGSGCTFSTTKTWTVTDACGNTGTATQTVTYTRDTQKPVITVAPPTAVPCNPTAADINGAFGAATVTDNCSAGLVATGTLGAEAGAGCIHTITKTWTVTDACGNVATPVTQTLTFTRDTTNPVITLTPAGIVPCNPTPGQISGAFGTATVTDNCSAGLTATGTLGAETGSGCTFSVTKTWTVTDACGNTGTTSQTITFTRDTQVPIITLTPAGILPCNPTAAQISGAFGTASVSDNCSVGLAATGTLGAETGSGCTFSVTKTWTVTDACGNTGNATQTVTFTRDTIKPVIVLAPPSAVPLCNPTPSDLTGAFGGATVTDNCSVGLTPSGTVGTETFVSGCTYSITKTWTATDACGNVANPVTQVILYRKDTTKPVITLTPAGTVPCNPTPGQISGAFGNATVTDNCSAGLTATGTLGAETGSGCTFSVTKTWTVTDSCGNTGTATQTLTFTRDTQVPIITLTPAGTLQCNPSASDIAGAFGTATVTDNCSSGLTATGTLGAETGSGCTFSVTKTWTVTDACGNTGTATQTVTFTRDTQLPVITLTAAGTVPCNPTPAQIAGAFGNATVTDNCSSGLTATGTLGAETGSGCTFSVTKTWTVTDACGNTGTATQTITFTRDTQVPVITLTPAGTLQCNPSSSDIAGAFGTASVTDNCSSGLTATGTLGTETGSGCTFSVTKTWTVTDACGNTGTASQTVTFTRDTQVPIIILTPAGTLQCNPTASDIAGAFGTASVTDNCSTGLTATGTLGAETGSGCTFSVTKTWTVTDACGNTGTASQTVTFTRDTQKPVITLAPPSSVPLCNPTPADLTGAFGGATVTDNCSVGLTPSGTVGPETNVSGCIYSVTKTWTATDACGNVADPVTQVILYRKDTTKPVITLTPTGTVPCNPTPGQISGAFGSATVTDNCSAGLAATGTLGAETGSGCTFSVTKTWTVTDSCGNTGTTTQTITFTRDTQVPVITLTPAGTLQCNPSSSDIAGAFGTASVTDNCSAGLVATGTLGAETGSGCTFSVTKTWTVTDACGNTGTALQTLTFTRDTIKPVITLAAPSSVPLCNPTPSDLTGAFGGATVTDNCSVGLTPSGTVGPETNVSGCIYSVTKTWTATDACGNVADPVTQVILYRKDTTKPVITLSPAGTVPCNPTPSQISGAFGNATVTDNCSAGLTATGTLGAETGSGCTFSVTKSWTVTDSCGNTGTASQTLTFTRDTQAPIITLTPAGTLACNPTAVQINGAFGTASVTDNCSAGLVATGTLGAETGSGCSFSITKTWTVTDACGNTGTASQTINYSRDTIKPTITCPPPMTFCQATSIPPVVVSDNCPGPLIVTYVITGATNGSGSGVSVGGGFNQGVSTITWIVRDGCGNVDSCSTTVTVGQVSSSSTSINICPAQLPYTWNGQVYNSAGTYSVTLTNASGCDSTATLILSVSASTSSTTNVTICPAQLPYSWNGQVYNSGGSYSITLQNSAGCDSVVTLNLTVNASTSSTTNVRLCPAQLPYTWNGQVYNSGGSYSITLQNSAGCDSIATLVLTISSNTSSTTNARICPAQLPYSWNGQVYNSGGSYSITLQNSAGCDSIATLILTISSNTSSTTNVSVCPAQLPYSWNGQVYNSGGSYSITLQNSAGCDSIATLILTVSASTSSTTNVTVCPAQLPYSWNGQVYNSGGSYSITLQNSAGCDSIATLILTINASTSSTTNVTVCPAQLPYSWNGQVYNSAGSYSITLQNSAGCDSIATLILTVNASTNSTTNVRLCPAQLPYSWNGQVYNSGGSYSITLQNSAGCDSIATLILTISPNTSSTTNVSVCPAQLPYSWNGQVYNTGGSYNVTLQNSAGCDSIATLILAVSASTSSTTNVTVCPAQLPYSWNGQVYNSAGSYSITLINGAGCDSVATLVLTISSATNSTTNVTVCPAQLPYSWNGQVYNSGGSYSITLQNSAGCDSIATLILTVSASTSSTTNVTVCPAQLPYSWNGQSYNAGGTYSITLQNSAGCDSIATLNLAVSSATTSTTNVTVCPAQLPYSWNGQTYNAGGTYSVTLRNSAGCDSIATLNLAVSSVLNSTTNVALCSSQLPYLWNGQSYNVGGSYSITLQNSAGCDSVATLVLSINPATTSTTNVTICPAQLPYSWNGLTYNAGGSYSVTLQNSAGCDSTATLNLAISAALNSTTNVSICPAQLPYSWNGQTYNAGGTYSVTLQNSAGCDSIATLNLAVSAATSSTTNVTVCPAQLPYSWNGQTYNAGGTYSVTLQNSAGCDSIATLNLAVSAALNSTTNVTICPTQLPYSWNGQTYNAGGTYSVTLQNSAGCDSIATLNLAISAATTSTTNVTVCPAQLPYSWNGQTYNASGTYSVTLQNSAGCDSIATLNLAVSAALNSTTNITICPAQLPYSWNGQTYNAGGTYSITLQNSAGCDSIATLNLAVSSVLNSTTNVTICPAQLPYSWNGQTYNVGGTYSVTLQNSAGCDSIATLNLAVSSVLNSTTNVAVCSSQLPYLWNGQSYNAGGSYSITLQNSAGCDSVATLVLSINPATTSTTNMTVCPAQLPYSWNGQSYNTGGSYSVTLHNSAGCDSIATLNLAVSASLNSTTNVTICPAQLPYSWNGQTYNVGGTYSVTLQNSAGCDSVATLNLAVSAALNSTTNVTICPAQLPYSWNGQTYNAGGTYSVTLQNSAGCDSIATLNLAVNSVLNSTTNVTVCPAQLPYSWNGQTYNAGGTYSITLQNSAGCDSIATLNLAVSSVLNSTTNVAVCSSQLPYLWNGQSYNTGGSYSVTLQNSAGCDSVATLVLSIKSATSSTTNIIICPAQLPYSWNGQTYNAGGTYSVTLRNGAGCDSVATLSLVVNSVLNSTINVALCSNQLPYTWNGQTYNTAGSYSATLRNSAGCDSVATLILAVNSATNSTTNVAICQSQLPYSWNGHTYTTGGVFNVTLRNSAGCDSIATLVLGVQKPTSSTTDVSVCSGQLPYLWNGHSYNAGGTYSVTLASSSGCDSVAILVLSVDASLQSMRYPTVMASPNVALQLSARNLGNNYTYQWDPPVGLNLTTVINPVFQFDSPIEYTISITPNGNTGCPVVDTLLVDMTAGSPTDILSDIYVPKAWTPNGDGHNDKLRPLTIKIREIKFFRIFNRWGQLMFEAHSIGEGWDGIFQGRPQIMDVYTWTLEAIGMDGKYYKKSGNSVLLR
jgi:gliding motility-associated-like protein